MKKWWLKLRVALTWPRGRRKALRQKYFNGSNLNPGAHGGNKVVRVEADGTRREIKDWYVPGATVIMTGRNNTLILEGEHHFHDVRFEFYGDGAYARIGRSGEDIGSLTLFFSNGGWLEIGQNFSCSYNGVFWVDKGKVSIGDDCMFSLGIRLRATDGHDILDERGRPVSAPGHIRIGNHVWVGENAYLLKNAVVGDNSIVGACTVSAGKYPQGNVILGGSPARVIKELKGTWRR